MDPVTRAILVGAPHREKPKPWHGCIAGLWVWVLFALALSAAGLVIGACCARF